MPKGSRQWEEWIKRQAQLELLRGTAIVWYQGTYTGAEWVATMMRTSGPLFFVGFRFILAGIFASILFWRSLRNLTLHDLFAGIVIGVPIFLGYSLQTAGLKTIASSQSAFITAVYVPLVPSGRQHLVW